MSRDWQRTFITLIPKRQDATEPGHFRPISLCSTLYKATTKILAVRLRDILPRLISLEQGAFLGGRSITDNVLIAQEFMFDLRRAPMRRSLMGIKLDMERAYDRVRWDFLQQSLQGFGFPEIWISWVMSCVRCPSFAILVNGTPSRFFESSRGLRQGCPLSPLLFTVCADALSRLLRHATSTQELEAYRPAEGAVSISHILYADDCLFPKTRVAAKHSILEILGVGEQVGILTYLGIPISGQRLRSRDLTFLELSIRQRLEGWQRLTLSMMGRITLVRSVLSAIPTYFLSNSLIPMEVLRTIEQLFRDFIWGGSGGRGGIHLVAWEVVCQPTRAGGLGLQSMVVRREALAALHVARFMLEPDSLWSSLMRAKYGALVPGIRAGRHHSPVWREMCARAVQVLPEITWSIGDGRSIDVLADRWVTEQPISLLPTLVDSARLVGCRVCDLYDQAGGQWREGLVRETFGEQLAEAILALPALLREESDRNAGIFEGRRISSRMVVDRALLQVGEVTAASAVFTSEMARDIWGTSPAFTAPRFALVSWVPPPLGHLKVNFDGSMMMDGVFGGVGFVIRDSWGRMVAAGGQRTMGLSVVGAELRAAWEGLSFAKRVLGAEWVLLEGDSSVVVDWIRGVDRYGDGHPLIREIRRLAQEFGGFQVAHVYREANRAADWVASFVARHSGEFLWTSVGEISSDLYSLLYRDLAGYLWIKCQPDSHGITIHCP
ncbi:uncharacterized protein LOC120106009 [Phoenix dactylifera]|uniref:Uncharacterized protein LOC120106009 n=1 Tax=Phoenix dactylifera TaxID=42345 RepID=A0A8B8ZTP5_PHODC|nr:uncharacterized protein LOC120106009 [Phoenix dactylifera]